MTCFLRPTTSCTAFMSLILTEPYRLNHVALLSSYMLPTQVEILPTWLVPLLARSAAFYRSYQLSLPYPGLQPYSNKQWHPPAGARGSPHCFVTTKPAPYRPCWFALFPSAAPVWLHMACSPPLGCEYMWRRDCCQSHLFSVKCDVFRHRILFRLTIPPSPTGWIGGDQNMPRP